MAVRWELEEGGTLLRIVTGDRFNTVDLLEAGRAALADTRARPPLRLLLDNRGSKESASHEELRTRATHMESGRAQFVSRIAVVVSDALHHGLARIGDAYVSDAGFEMQIFQEDVESARAWLLR